MLLGKGLQLTRKRQGLKTDKESNRPVENKSSSIARSEHQRIPNTEFEDYPSGHSESWYPSVLIMPRTFEFRKGR